MNGTEEWFLAPALEVLRDQINEAYPGRDKASDGSIGDAAHNARKTDHNADWQAGGIVRALDVDEDLYGPGTGPTDAPALALVSQLITDPRVAYLIYEGRIWTPARGWRPYTAEGKAGWFNPHKMHFHLSLRHGKKWDHDTTPWAIAAPNSQEDLMAQQISDADAAAIVKAAHRINGTQRSRSNGQGGVWSVLDEGDGAELVREINASTARAVAETSAAYHKTLAEMRAENAKTLDALAKAVDFITGLQSQLIGKGSDA